MKRPGCLMRVTRCRPIWYSSADGADAQPEAATKYFATFLSATNQSVVSSRPCRSWFQSRRCAPSNQKSKFSLSAFFMVKTSSERATRFGTVVVPRAAGRRMPTIRYASRRRAPGLFVFVSLLIMQPLNTSKYVCNNPDRSAPSFVYVLL